MSKLEELYNGNICPSDRFIKKGSEYQRLSCALVESEDKLLETLNDDQKTLYDSVFENRFKQENISEREIFVEGFRLGAQIMLEIFTEPEKQLI